MKGPISEGQQKALHHTSAIANGDWTTVTYSDFKLLTTGQVPDKGFLAEVSMRNLGATDVYVSFGYEPNIDGADEAAKVVQLKNAGIQLPPGSFQHIELTGVYADKLSFRVLSGVGEVQSHAVFLVR